MATTLSHNPGPIGVFDSGCGGLTILDKVRSLLPQYDYLYLGDNARAPYGTRSFDVVYRYTLQSVTALFERGCQLVILACNTASAKALRSIQQRDLPRLDPDRRVLGVIRPTAEVIGDLTRSRHVGLMATPGTIISHSYDMEIKKLHPDIQVTGEACPMWVPLVENFEIDSAGTDYFIEKRIRLILTHDPKIDTIILGCTHYPLLMKGILRFTPEGVQIVEQGEYVARSLQDYFKRHPRMEQMCTKNGNTHFLTTEDNSKFDTKANFFLGQPVCSERIVLGE